jgi:hypothetical protein
VYTSFNWVSSTVSCHSWGGMGAECLCGSELLRGPKLHGGVLMVGDLIAAPCRGCFYL